MITSKQQTFSDGQVVTADAASTNVIDLGAPGTVLGAPAAMVRNIGKGRPVPLYVQLDADASGTTPTLDVRLEVDNDVNFGSAKVVARSEQIAGGAAGDRVSLYAVGERADERYMRLFYDVGGTTPSYTISAGIPLADQTAP